MIRLTNIIEIGAGIANSLFSHYQSFLIATFGLETGDIGRRHFGAPLLLLA